MLAILQIIIESDYEEAINDKIEEIEQAYHSDCDLTLIELGRK